MKKITLIIAFVTFFLLFALVNNHKQAQAVPFGNFLELLGGYAKAVNTNITFPSEIAIEAWINPDSTSGYSRIISIGDKNNSRLYYELGINGGSLHFNLRYGISSQKILTAGFIEEGVWNHVFAVVNNNSTKLFINGEQVISTSGANNLMPAGPHIVLGRSYLASVFDNNVFEGSIDEVILSADGQNVALWHLDEVRGETIAQDSSGNDIDAALIGGDSNIHFFGVEPTDTPFVFPTLRRLRFTRPTLSWPGDHEGEDNNPTSTPIPTLPDQQPTPTPTDSESSSIRQNRPVLPR